MSKVTFTTGSTRSGMSYSKEISDTLNLPKLKEQRNRIQKLVDNEKPYIDSLFYISSKDELRFASYHRNLGQLMVLRQLIGDAL
mgnify:CR=1 FL=1|tara:strand:+ start:371 stop:622 length:252 start_codon:yes stop_codon:yes gene_type:complete